MLSRWAICYCRPTHAAVMQAVDLDLQAHAAVHQQRLRSIHGYPCSRWSFYWLTVSVRYQCLFFETRLLAVLRTFRAFQTIRMASACLRFLSIPRFLTMDLRRHRGEAVLGTILDNACPFKLTSPAESCYHACA